MCGCRARIMATRAPTNWRIQPGRRRDLIMSQQEHSPQVQVGAAPMPDENRLLWVDMEMSGLSPDTDRVLELAVVVTDTFGRPWREGVVNVALGVAGLRPLVDYRGCRDPYGRELHSTVIAVADEIADCDAETDSGWRDRRKIIQRNAVAPDRTVPRRSCIGD